MKSKKPYIKENQKNYRKMKFIKDKNEKRRDYLFQKDKKTIIGARIIGFILLVLVSAVIISGIDFEFSSF